MAAGGGSALVGAETLPLFFSFDFEPNPNPPTDSLPALSSRKRGLLFADLGVKLSSSWTLHVPFASSPIRNCVRGPGRFRIDAILSFGTGGAAGEQLLEAHLLEACACDCEAEGGTAVEALRVSDLSAINLLAVEALPLGAS